MAISVNPILPVLAAQAAAPDLLLQPGTVIDAQVLKILSDNVVQIAIAGLSIDVLSEVPLTAGQTLQLAVSQTPDSVRLAIVGPGSGAAADVSGDSVALSPNTLRDLAANPSPGAVALKNVLNILTPPEQAAVAVAAQSAATRQQSLAPLFANLGVVAKDTPRGHRDVWHLSHTYVIIELCCTLSGGMRPNRRRGDDFHEKKAKVHR